MVSSLEPWLLSRKDNRKLTWSVLNSKDDPSNQCFHYLFWNKETARLTVMLSWAKIEKNRIIASTANTVQTHTHTILKNVLWLYGTEVTHVPSSSSKHTNVWGTLSSGSDTTKSNGRDNWRHKVRFQSTLWYRLAVRALLIVRYDVLREICRKVVFKRNVLMIESKVVVLMRTDGRWIGVDECRGEGTQAIERTSVNRFKGWSKLGNK